MRLTRLVFKWIGILVVMGMLFFGVYVRVLPTVPTLWHTASYPSGLGHLERPNSHIWRGPQQDDGKGDMAGLDHIILDTPRTSRIAGSVETGMMTYITRSKWWAFPDFTTLERDVLLIEGGPRMISIHSRAQFGESDLGVNERRLRKWMVRFEAGR